MPHTEVLHDAIFKFDDVTSPEMLSRPETPIPDESRTLRRTASYASIQTILPRDNQGIRRRIVDIAKGVKQKSSKRKKEDPSTQTQDDPKPEALELALGPKHVPANKPRYKRKAKTIPPLQTAHRRSEEGGVGVHHVHHNAIPSAQFEPTTALFGASDSLFGVPLENDFPEEDSHPSLRGAYVIPEGENPPQQPLVLKAGFKDVKLEIRPSESDVTIWDGLQASQHVFKCRLYLRCTTYPFNAVAMPDLDRVEMTCSTYPAGSRYARSPVLLATYGGRCSGIEEDGSPHVDLQTGIQIDVFWRTMLDEDVSSWGWCREVSVPLSPRLFDKMEYREFKLASQVRMGGDRVEGELTFGISMLLRGVDMM